MDSIIKITDEDINEEAMQLNNPRIRIASRGIVIREEDGKIAILNKANKNEFKLVGGGMEENENPELAFKREVLEEAGCEVEILKSLGTVEEYRTHHNFKQISNIFVARVIKDLHHLELTEKEIAEGAQLLWMYPDEALEKIKESFDKVEPSGYEDIYATKFVVTRDRKILEYYLNKGE